MDTICHALARLSDTDLVAEVKRLARHECQATAQLIASLAVLDARQLYLGEGYSSLFAYCVGALHLGEHASYHRIEAARVARRFPLVLERLAEGTLTLTVVTLLAPHLTADNHRALIDAVRHKSKRDVEHLLAALHPAPDVPASVRKLPAPAGARRACAGAADPQRPKMPEEPSSLPAGRGRETGAEHASAAHRASAAPPPRPAVVGPLAPERYKVQVTITAQTHRKLRRAQDLLRHSIPDGDIGAVLDRALTVLLEKLERTKLAARKSDRPVRAAGQVAVTGSLAPEPPQQSNARCGPALGSEGTLRKKDVAEPRSPSAPSRPVAPSPASGPERRSRHIPAAVRRAVWVRDQGSCAFAGTDGHRCGATAFLEYHHVVPYARGGDASVEGISLRCRSHNNHEAARDFGRVGSGNRKRARAATTRCAPGHSEPGRTRPGPS